MRDDGDNSVLVDRNEDVRVRHHAMRHLFGAGGIRHGCANRWELRSEDEHARTGHALEQAASADIGEDNVLLIADGSSCYAPFEAARTAEWMRW